MPKGILYTVYVLMAAVGLVAMYTLLNAGNPQSLLRPWLPDPRHDVWLAMGSSVVVFVLGFLVFYNRDRQGFERLLEFNAEQIRRLRKGGHTDEQIADAILAAMGSRSGYRHNLARRKLIAYLSEFR